MCQINSKTYQTDAVWTPIKRKRVWWKPRLMCSMIDSIPPYPPPPPPPPKEAVHSNKNIVTSVIHPALHRAHFKWCVRKEAPVKKELTGRCRRKRIVFSEMLRWADCKPGGRLVSILWFLHACCGLRFKVSPTRSTQQRPPTYLTEPTMYNRSILFTAVGRRNTDNRSSLSVSTCLVNYIILL